MSVEKKEELKTRILKTVVFEPKDESERRQWKNEQIDLEYHVNTEHRCAFIYNPGKITMLLFRNTEDMLAEIGVLELEAEETCMSLDVHFQD